MTKPDNDNTPKHDKDPSSKKKKKRGKKTRRKSSKDEVYVKPIAKLNKHNNPKHAGKVYNKRRPKSSDDDVYDSDESADAGLSALAKKLELKYNKRKKSDRIKNMKKSKPKEEEEEEEEEEWTDEEYGGSSESSDYTTENESEYEDEDEFYDEMDEEECKNFLKENMKFNIIFTVGDKGHEVDEYGYAFDDDDEYDYNYDPDEYEQSEEEDEEDEGDEEEECRKTKGFSLITGDTGTGKTGTGKTKKKVDKKTKSFNKGDVVIYKINDQDYKCKILKKKLVMLKTKKKVYRYKIKIIDDQYKKSKKIKENIKEGELRWENEGEIDDKALVEMREMLEEYRVGGKKNMVAKLENMICANESIIKKEKKKKDKITQNNNTQKLRKLLREKNVMNDFKYFGALNVEKQAKIISELEEINKVMNVEKPYRITLLETDIPREFKADALKKINLLSFMSPETGEYYKIKQWVDTFMRIPFGKHHNLPLSIEDGPEKCHDFIAEAKKTLDGAVYGMDDAKMQIMQMVGQWISNPQSVGTAIAIKGPMGTGKTTLVKEGVSKILNRPFAFLALGGATDSSFLEGHSYTYEGSSWGKIIDILIQCQCMNPVIYFDELDKVSDTPKGEEIIGILTHLTDTTQNSQFHDKYFSNMDFDLSKALFIFSYNDESKVNPILRDRMYKITTKGYSGAEKITIAQKYLKPTIRDLVKFEDDNIIIPDDTIKYICEHLTNKEHGVRNLKRCLEIIYSKLNLFRLTNEPAELFNNEKTFKIKFPFTVTVDVVTKLINTTDENQIPFGMYI